MVQSRHIELRRQKCIIRNELSDSERRRENEIIFKKLIDMEHYRSAESILIYASYHSEADTFRIIRYSLENQKKVYCPRVEEKELEFYRIFSVDDLKEGFRNIPEPDGSTEKFRRMERTVVIAPGTVFDPNGHRIGYGGGFYDRYLSKYKKEDRPFCIGICFGCQMTEKIIPMQHDIPMDMIVHS